MFEILFGVLWNFIKAFVLLCLAAAMVIAFLIVLGNGEFFEFFRTFGIYILGFILLCTVVSLYDERQKSKKSTRERPATQQAKTDSAGSVRQDQESVEELLDGLREEFPNIDFGRASNFRTVTRNVISNQSKKTATVDSHGKVIGDKGTTIRITITSEVRTDSDQT